MKNETIDPNGGPKESWVKPELTLLAIKEDTLGTHSLHGTDTSYSS